MKGTDPVSQFHFQDLTRIYRLVTIFHFMLFVVHLTTSFKHTVHVMAQGKILQQLPVNAKLPLTFKLIIVVP